MRNFLKVSTTLTLNILDLNFHYKGVHEMLWAYFLMCKL